MATKIKAKINFIYTLKHIPEILIGWFNAIFRKSLQPELVKKREEVCNTCPLRINNQCGVCGCFLEAKVRVDLDKPWGQGGCPMNKW